MNNGDLLQIIEDGMSSFSKGQRLIAAYILEHYDKAAYYTASRLGTIVGVSRDNCKIIVQFDAVATPRTFDASANLTYL